MKESRESSIQRGGRKEGPFLRPWKIGRFIQDCIEKCRYAWRRYWLVRRLERELWDFTHHGDKYCQNVDRKDSQK